MMPSHAPTSSSGSLVVKSNNQVVIEARVRHWARHLAETRPEIQRIIWFGSRVNGVPAPGSDVDVCLVISRSDRCLRDRIGDYLPFGFPVGMDLFPYTVAEFERLRHEHPSWHEAIASGIDLLASGDVLSSAPAQERVSEDAPGR